MNKQQKEYLVNKLRAASSAAKSEFSTGKTISHAAASSVTALQEAGFVYNTVYGGQPVAGGWSLPLTEEMLSNKQSIAKFNSKVDAELTKAIDTVYLGSDEAALAILESFTDAIRQSV